MSDNPTYTKEHYKDLAGWFGQMFAVLRETQAGPLANPRSAIREETVKALYQDMATTFALRYTNFDRSKFDEASGYTE